MPIFINLPEIKNFDPNAIQKYLKTFGINEDEFNKLFNKLFSTKKIVLLLYAYDELSKVYPNIYQLNNF